MRLNDIFVTLAKIPSPSGQEKQVADWIVKYFEALGISANIDRSGFTNSSDTGNVIVRIPGQAGKNYKILLTAHMDTVQKPGEVVKPILKNGMYRSDGKTILGADNKSGVAILLKAAEEIFKADKKLEIIMAFTTREENGVMGSAMLDVKEIKPDLIINVDGGKSPGTIDIKALGQKVFKIKFYGKAAHAAVAPETGAHAIHAAAETVTQINSGKKENGDCLNIGLIAGGEDTNIVPDYAEITGEIRSFSRKRLEQIYHQLGVIADKNASKFRVKSEIEDLKTGVPVWGEAVNGLNKDWKKLSKAAAKVKLKLRRSSMSASSDANFLSASGTPTVSINRGGSNAHTTRETIKLVEMEQTKRFIIAIIDEYADS